MKYIKDFITEVCMVIASVCALTILVAYMKTAEMRSDRLNAYEFVVRDLISTHKYFNKMNVDDWFNA